MKIAILGTRGIPNNYGGFEQFAEYLSVGLLGKGHDVYVYNSSTHPYSQKEWNGVKLIHCFDPENKIGTAGQFIYDFNCILDSRKRDFDVILQLGYTSNSIWHWMLPKKRSTIITNMDGLEWKRTKYSRPVKKFLRYAEKLAVGSSDFLISDSLGIQDYLEKKYNVYSSYIAYGANTVSEYNVHLISQFNLAEFGYDMLIARLEPENNIEMILEGYLNSKKKREFLVVGNFETKYGAYVRNLYEKAGVRFIGSVYDIDVLNSLRYFSNLYFHGHSVGGTNPSLLEAMASEALVCYHDNEFNSAIVGKNGFEFSNSAGVSELLDTAVKQENLKIIKTNRDQIRKDFAWSKIIDRHAELFDASLQKKAFK